RHYSPIRRRPCVRILRARSFLRSHHAPSITPTYASGDRGPSRPVTVQPSLGTPALEPAGSGAAIWPVGPFDGETIVGALVGLAPGLSDGCPAGALESGATGVEVAPGADGTLVGLTGVGGAWFGSFVTSGAAGVGSLFVGVVVGTHTRSIQLSPWAQPDSSISPSQSSSRPLHCSSSGSPGMH